MTTTPCSSPRMRLRWASSHSPGEENPSTVSAPHSSITRGGGGSGGLVASSKVRAAGSAATPCAAAPAAGDSAAARAK